MGEDTLVSVLESYLAQGHVYFAEVLAQFPDADYRTVLRLMGRFNEEGKLERDELGRYRFLTGERQKGS